MFIMVSFSLYGIRLLAGMAQLVLTLCSKQWVALISVGDEAVNRFISRPPHADYFLNLVKFFQEQCIHLDKVVSNAKK